MNKDKLSSWTLALGAAGVLFGGIYCGGGVGYDSVFTGAALVIVGIVLLVLTFILRNLVNKEEEEAERVAAIRLQEEAKKKEAENKRQADNAEQLRKERIEREERMRRERERFVDLRFPVAGVTFRNADGSSRQKILKEICMGDEYGFTSAELEEYEYEGDPAIRVNTSDGCVGNIRRSDISKVLPFFEHIVHSISLDVETFENEDDKTIYRADVVIRMDRDDPEQNWFFSK